MKNLYKSLGIILVSLVFLSCQKKPVPPVISTTPATEISTVSAVSGGNITNDGGAPIISKGICWNTATDPTIANNKTNESGESLSFTSNITQLIPSTLYYARAYATNSAGTSYGKSESFKTLGDKPVSNSQNASNIQVNSATLNGNVNPNSFSTVVTFEYGITTNYGSTITAVQSPLTGNLPANVSVDLTGLTAGATYHFRIKAENSLGITFSSDMTFTTLGQVPTATGQSATSLQINSATLNGVVNPNLLSTSTIFEWGLTTSYGSAITAVQSPVIGSTAMAITANLSGLNPGTTYHFRIKAENSLGITYSSDLTFKTLGQLPTVTVLPVSNLQINTSTLNGSVNANYLSTSAAFEWGTTTSYGNTVLALQSPIIGNTESLISSNLPGLAPGTTYHFRIKSENALGVTYSSDMTFTTLGQVPTATSQAATSIQVNSATINGSVNSNYLNTTTSFEWGTTISYGSIAVSGQNPVTGNTVTNISANISGLLPGTTYHFRIKAENILGISYSSDLTFTTLGTVPTATVQSVSNLQMSTTTIHGIVNPNYLSTTVSFQWGPTTSYGSTGVSLQSPVTGSSPANVSLDLSGLTPGTTYHFRITATNELGTTNSNDLIFTTLAPITDIDGNSYNIRTIGTQVWMTENLKTTKYNNGDLIGTTSPITLDISNENMPKYQWAYEGNESYAATYGRLYTGYAVTDPRKVCPSGWHIPSDEEWTTLTNYLTNNGYGYEGSGDDIGKSMAAISLWAFNSTPGNVGNDLTTNNKSGFSALPAGYRINNDNVDGIFVTLNWICSWWSSTDLTDKIAWQRIMQNQFNNVNRNYIGVKRTGISARCIKD